MYYLIMKTKDDKTIYDILKNKLPFDLIKYIIFPLLFCGDHKTSVSFKDAHNYKIAECEICCRFHLINNFLVI